jgi:hypothetical protein
MERPFAFVNIARHALSVFASQAMSAGYGRTFEKAGYTP